MEGQHPPQAMGAAYSSPPGLDSTLNTTLYLRYIKEHHTVFMTQFNPVEGIGLVKTRTIELKLSIDLHNKRVIKWRTELI